MSTHRVCCVSCEAEPRMVRAGWYHFLVMDNQRGVTCIIGSPVSEYSGDIDYTACEPDPTNAVHGCAWQVIPSDAPAGHPLQVPMGDGAEDLGVKSAANPGGAEVIDICCGAYHNLVRTSDNRIIAWGLNSYGQCNVPDSLKNGTHPKRERIVGLHAGYSNSAVTFNDGTVLCWGDPVVADEVNQWTDLMMSPVQHDRANFGTKFGDINNVDPNSNYAKPAYQAAYDASVSGTWNLASDPMFKWHSAAQNLHCVPSFDLGVETDPCNPMEAPPYSGAEWPIPSAYHTRYPLWPSYNSAVCDSDFALSLSSDDLAKYFDQRMRMDSFASNKKSCCDLEVKRDFAVGIRRTGQVLSTRTENRKTTGNTENPACPNGVSCRDCSADAEVSATCRNMGTFRSGCGAVGSACYAATCDCCIGAHGNVPGTVGDCPDCTQYISTTQQRFTIPRGDITNQQGGCTNYFFEGIGCVSTNPNLEEKFHDEEWATPWVQTYDKNAIPQCTGQLRKRWDAGKQVKPQNGAVSAVPPANAAIQAVYGWSTFPAAEDAEKPGQQDQTCVRSHTVGTPCNAMNEDWPSTYEIGAIRPDWATQYNYPAQMFMQSVSAGCNTTAWHSQALGISTRGMNGDDCLGCSTWGEGNINCGANTFQETAPNGGTITYGTIYTGENVFGHAQGSFDKYGQVNPYRYGNGEPCDVGFGMYAIENYKFPSKPWGPGILSMWNALGADKNYRYPDCHCCSGDTPVRLPPEGMIRVIGGWDASQLDGWMGTIYGMPYESALNCIGSGAGDTCSLLCSNAFPADGSGPLLSGFGIPFCYTHPAQSWASARMAFAIVRPDHRDCVRDPQTHECVVVNNFTVRAEPNGSCDEYPEADPLNPVGGKDPSGIFGCNPDSNGQAGTPIIRRKPILTIWGSLWDPCSPFPRLCSCSPIVDAEGHPDDWPFGPGLPIFSPQNYIGPCDGTSHEYTESGGVYSPPPELDPSDADNGKPHYPGWTRRAAASRVASKGAFVSGVWTIPAPADFEPTVATTINCPNCDLYEMQYENE